MAWLLGLAGCMSLPDVTWFTYEGFQEPQRAANAWCAVRWACDPPYRTAPYTDAAHAACIEEVEGWLPHEPAPEHYDPAVAHDCLAAIELTYDVLTRRSCTLPDGRALDPQADLPAACLTLYAP